MLWWQTPRSKVGWQIMVEMRCWCPYAEKGLTSEIFWVATEQPSTGMKNVSLSCHSLDGDEKGCRDQLQGKLGWWWGWWLHGSKSSCFRWRTSVVFGEAAKELLTKNNIDKGFLWLVCLWFPCVIAKTRWNCFCGVGESLAADSTVIACSLCFASDFFFWLDGLFWYIIGVLLSLF